MKLTLRSVISIIAGISIIAISATVIAIVSTLYTDAAKKIGLSYAKQLGKSGAQQVENYFLDQFKLVDAIKGALLSREKEVKLPADFESMTATDFCDESRTIIRNSNGTLSELAILFDDGGSMFYAQYATLPNGTTAIRCALSNTFNSDVTGYSIATHLCFDYETRQEYDDLAIFPPVWGSAPRTAVDVRPTLYATGRPTALRLPNFYLPPLVLRRNTVPPDSILALTSSTTLRNSSDTFVGVLVANINLEVLTSFLDGIDLSENSHAVVVYSNTEMIVASTHPAPIATERDTVSTLSTNGCLNSAQTQTFAVNTEYCPVSILNYAFRPLAILRERNETIFTNPYTFEGLELSDGGDRYLVSNYKLSNPGELFSITVTFFVYYNTIIGDVEAGRNVSIGIGVGIFGLAVGVSIALVFVLLAPLEVVSMQMNATSKLRLRLARRIGGDSFGVDRAGEQQQRQQTETGNLLSAEESNLFDQQNAKKEGNNATRREQDENSIYSSILELFLLQKAYTNMHAAVDSFTRYIPKDLVKNLLATGQLTKNTASGASVSRGLVSMSQKNNTMLMADVQGFTSISERVQIGDLSPVLSIFFEHMSSAIMQHEGIIVMYIGDAISATFGGDFACEYPQVKACLAALQMTRETCMPTLSDAFASIGETLNLRIGINSGVVLSGILGSRDRVAYSILGQASDLASSLEAWNKKFKTRVLISDVVAQEVERFFLVRCVYASPLSSSADEAATIRNRAEFAPGLSVVAPEDAKEFWKQNAEKISSRGFLNNAHTAVNHSDKTDQLTTNFNDNTHSAAGGDGSSTKYHPLADNFALSLSTTTPENRSLQNANGLLVMEDVSSPGSRSDSPQTSTKNLPPSAVVLQLTDSPQVQALDPAVEKANNDNNVDLVAFSSASASSSSSLLCYEVVGILPLNRIYFPAIEDQNRKNRNNLRASSRRSGENNNKNNDFSESGGGNTNNESFGTGSFSETDTNGISNGGMFSVMSNQNNNNSNSDSDNNNHNNIQDQDKTSSQQNNNMMRSRLRRRSSVDISNVKIVKNNNTNATSRRKKDLSELFHHAVGTSSYPPLSSSDQQQQEINQPSYSYPCSIVATEAEIEFCTKYTLALLSAMENDHDDDDIRKKRNMSSMNENSYNNNNTTNAATIRDLIEEYSAFFYIGEDEDVSAEDERLQRLREIVGENRCPASLINAFKSQIKAVL